MALVMKNPPANAGDIRDTVRSLGQEDPLEKEMATHSSILAWEVPQTEEPCGRQSMKSQRVGHNWATEHTGAIDTMYKMIHGHDKVVTWSRI